jgi:3-oxoacyl-[acyl-carrier-protein] synthase II
VPASGRDQQQSATLDQGNDRLALARPERVVAQLGNTGHTGSAAGAMAVVAGVRAMSDGRLPHVAGTTNLDPAVRFDVVLHEPRTIDVDVLQVNAFGFGGQNASVVFTRN